MSLPTAFKLKNPVRIVTAASLFDGHDASINIMRRLLQEFGAEVIHLGHNRSVADVVKCALQEGAQGICVSSYQGGHMEYFKYMKDLLEAYGAGYVKIFGGGGGVIIHEEKKELELYGITQIFHPEDGRRLGLEGMIQTIVEACDFDINAVVGENNKKTQKAPSKGPSKTPNSKEAVPSLELGLALSSIENHRAQNLDELLDLKAFEKGTTEPVVLGVTGTGGAGKSSLIDELAQRFLNAFPEKRLAILCVDPSKRKTGGSLLGDRIRMNSLSRDRIYMRSLASRGSGNEISNSLPLMVQFLKNYKFDLIIAETSGIGQGNMAVTEISDLSLYVMTSEFGAPTQLEKIDMIDYANVIAVNKADRRGAQDALKDVTKQFKRSRKIFNSEVAVPVFLTQASLFNDRGVNELFFSIIDQISKISVQSWEITTEYRTAVVQSEEQVIIPSERENYLSEIVSTVRKYKKNTEAVSQKVRQWGALELVKSMGPEFEKIELLEKKYQSLDQEIQQQLSTTEIHQLKNWKTWVDGYKKPEFKFEVRGKTFSQPLFTESLSGLKIPKLSLPQFSDWGDRYRFLKLENLPGEFPYTAGVFPLKRNDEDPKRMFAGEGPPERTNQRFHYLCQGEKAHRLSTAFDSVTLYGQDPDLRPDIFGKVGESGVSICTLHDMKKLYAGFDLIAPNTSVSMTINGPAPMILAFYFNAAIDQQVEKKEKELQRPLWEKERQELALWTLQQLRGTVQADILKEDQGQNTCIFSINFALKMMGDIQEYFVKQKIKNFYSVSISGYHIAEAGANPISQLAFTLSNGFTFVEYYLARGIPIDEFAGNLSFFFSNGLDPEYTVLGRVARRIWAIAMRDLYKAHARSQKLKYHIQTSGRSLHAQEISFNDIRTTLQALLAISDNCNSLHTNAYDEAITTPTEESVRRAMAIQLIINKEFGYSKNENPLQGSYFVEELTDLVEEAVLSEFLKISERGGVLGAMETQYQRSKIQEESLYYERLKHDGTLPLVGVNTFQDPKTLEAGYTPPPIQMARASFEEKKFQLDQLELYKTQHQDSSEKELQNLKTTALKGENIFEALMSAARHCSLYQMTQALYEVGGQYRRNL